MDSKPVLLEFTGPMDRMHLLRFEGFQVDHDGDVTRCTSIRERELEAEVAGLRQIARIADDWENWRGGGDVADFNLQELHKAVLARRRRPV